MATHEAFNSQRSRRGVRLYDSTTPAPSALDRARHRTPPHCECVLRTRRCASAHRSAHLPQSSGGRRYAVTFSRRVVTDGSDVPIDAFTVLTRSGEKKTPVCATLEPATEASEGHTVLLIGEFGDESDDPPARVQITGSLPLEGGVDGQGLEWDVTPLKEGPTIVMAVAFPTEAIETDCPTTTKQVVMAVWAGGVTPAKGETDESHRMMYTVESAAGSSTPFALGNLGDRDNYVHLCLEASTPAVRVRARAGVLVDPRGDLNPDTAVSVVR